MTRRCVHLPLLFIQNILLLKKRFLLSLSEFEVYLKSKMAGLSEVQLKNLENKLRNLENFSAKSVDNSKGSVYYTPTDYTLSPHTSPIHINYLNENEPDFSDIGFKLNGEPERLVGGGFDGILNDRLSNRKILRNLDDSCTLNTYDEEDFNECDDDYDNDGAKAIKVNMIHDKLSSALCNHHEYDKLLVNDIKIANKSQILTMHRKRKRYNNDYYYSVENVFDAKSLHNHNSHQIHCKEQSSVDTINIVDVDDTGKTILTKYNCDNPLQTSTSLPEIQLNATKSEVHGKHVLLAIENTDNHIQKEMGDVVSEITKL